MSDNKAPANTAGKVTIKIPRPLYNKVTEAIEGGGYNSVTDFVVYVLRDLVASCQTNQNHLPGPTEMEKVKQRLRALGYLNQ